MYISELAERTGFTTDTIRFYEKMKLLSGNRTSRQGHRQYDESHIAALRQIKFAKAMGFTLKEMQEKLAGWHTGQLTDNQKRTILTDQLQKMNQAAAEIDQVRTYLREKIARLEENACVLDGVTSYPSPIV